MSTIQTQVPDSTRIESVINVSAMTVTLKFPGVGDLAVDLKRCAAQVRDYSALYGMMVRLTRATAISRDPKTGKSATLREKFDSAKALSDHYMSGAIQWELRARSERPDSLLAQAIAQWSGKDLEGIIAKLNEMSRSDRTKLQTHPEIAPIYAKLLSEQDGSSAEDLLASI